MLALLVRELVNSYLLCCIYNTIIKFPIFLHQVMIDFTGKNIILGELLTSPSFNLNIGFKAGGPVKGNNNLAINYIEPLLSDTCCDQDPKRVLFFFKLFYCSYLCLILLLNL